MTVQEAITYIENYTWSTTRLGLDRTRELLRALGNPQKKLKFIHVAGSNGKGSTCAMLDSILRCAGYRTGLYTSPYILDFCERMRIDGRNIPGEELARITEKVRPLADAMDDHPSQFELVTAIAMEYFAAAACDIVVLEVGMGGALDSTNVIDSPEAAVITNIGLEHTEYLGSTLALISEAKGGIIKPGCTAVCYDNVPEVMDTLRRICEEQHAQLRVSGKDDLRSISHDLHGQVFTWKGLEYVLPLLGAHQLRNAGTVLETVAVLRERGWCVPEDAVCEGLRTVEWPARFEILSYEPLFILDGGHNPQCAQALARNLADYVPNTKFTFLLGVLKDKDYLQMLELVFPFAAEFVCLTPLSPRALPAEDLAALIREKGWPAVPCASVEDGIRAALDTGAPVLAFGSLYLAGHVRASFPKQLKQKQRRTALAARDAVPEKRRAEKSAQICGKIEKLDIFLQAKTVFLYRAFRSEADLSPLLLQDGSEARHFLYPVCGEGCTMEAVLPEEGTGWSRDRFGILVPDRYTVFPPEDIDLVLCPCSAFDEHGNRLGMGAGYYDRFLPKCEKAGKVLVAFDAQCLEQVCTEGCDVQMDAVVTETRVIRFDHRNFHDLHE